MSADPLEPARNKAGHHQEWGEAAEGWKEKSEIVERAMQVVSDRLVELAQIESGDRALDVATGIGEPAVTAARRVGPSGLVVAIDQAPQMLAIARQRAAAEGLRNIEFLEMNAESLKLPEGSFDAALCRMGLMFFSNLSRALEGIRRLLIPGAWLAAATWAEPSKVQHLGVSINTVRRCLQLPPSQPGMPGPFSLADARALEQSLTNAGFTEVRSERLMAMFEFDSAEDYARRRLAVSGTINAMLANESAERRATVGQAMTDAARPYVAADGIVRMPAESICVVGRRKAE